LSVLWRASVAAGRPFQEVSLGPHEESIRQMLLAEDVGNPEHYPIVGNIFVFPDTRRPAKDAVTLKPSLGRSGTSPSRRSETAPNAALHRPLAATSWVAEYYHAACGPTPVSLGPLARPVGSCRGYGRAPTSSRCFRSTPSQAARRLAARREKPARSLGKER
jgi:hypothetical protein